MEMKKKQCNEFRSNPFIIICIHEDACKEMLLKNKLKIASGFQ